MFDKAVKDKVEIRYCHIKKHLELRRLLDDIKENFDRYIKYDVWPSDSRDINFYYKAFSKLYEILKRFRTKIIIRGRYEGPYEIVDPYVPVGF